MRYFLTFLIYSFFSLNTFAQSDIQALYANVFFNPELVRIENTFNALFSDKHVKVAYTRVPRGLIISVAESEIFNKGDYKIKPRGYEILDIVVSVLNTYSNSCVVESHTDEEISQDRQFSEDWEISVMRANQITDYIVQKGKISRNRVFPLGFGEMMPFRENVSQKGFQDSRVDFVFIDYEYKR